MDALFEQVDRDAEIPGEHPLIIEVPSKKKVMTMMLPLTLLKTRPEPLSRLKEEGATEAPPTDGGLLVFWGLPLD